MIKLLFLTFFISINIYAEQVKFGLNDVSILLPLPALSDWNLLPNPETVAAKGVLLPKEIFLQVPQLLAFASNEDMYTSLHVVGIRVDPCFAEGQGPIKCQTQIRLVWQPFTNSDTETSTFDTSLHTFHQLSESEFKSLIADLKNLKNEQTPNADDPVTLGVNPIIKREGLSGAYYTKLTKIIFSYIGESNFSRITFMQLSMQGNVWVFGGFDFANGELKPIKIPRVGSFTQSFRNSATPRPIWFIGGMTPEPTQPENFNILTRDSRKLAPQDEASIIEATKSAFKFENPKLHNPGTVDCVSCHVAQPAKIWAMRQYPWLQLDNSSRDVIYKSNSNLANMSPMQIHTNIVRAFGYFMDMPFVAQRTINESAEVVNYLNLNY